MYLCYIRLFPNLFMTVSPPVTMRKSLTIFLCMVLSLCITQEPHAENIDAAKEVELHLLRSRVSGLSGCWELDIFALPMPIGQVPERPHFPICFLAVETKLGLVLGTNLTEPWLSLSQKQDEVIQILRKANQLPREIRVKSNKVRQIMQPITTILGIKLRVGPLPMLEQAKSSLYEHFSA